LSAPLFFQLKGAIIRNFSHNSLEEQKPHIHEEDALDEERLSLADRLREWHTKSHSWQYRFLTFLKNISGYRVVRVFRNYSAFSIVASSALMVSASNFAQGQGNESFLLGYIGEDQSAEVESAQKKRFAMKETGKNLALVPLADPATGVDPNQKDDTSLFDVEASAFESQVVLSSNTTNIAKDPEEEGGVTIYTVEDGDTVSGVAAKFGITVNTILWANDFDNVDAIKPNDQIFILPVAGLTHVVKGGETIESIAGQYKADKEKIIAFNSLPANGEVETGASIVIPDGKKEVEEKVEKTDGQNGLTRRQYANTSGGTAEVSDISGYRTPQGKAGSGHRFPYGYCTWYVASKRYVPWGGNAGTWLYNAKAQGYRTGKSPAVGSIVVTTENRYYGHVAYVEKVSGGVITVSEMNYAGWGKTSRRTLSTSSRAIKGYIY
jgi:surface antigen